MEVGSGERLNEPRPGFQGEPSRYVFLKRPRCPNCGGERILAQRSKLEDDGARTRYVKCGSCGFNHVHVIE